MIANFGLQCLCSDNLLLIAHESNHQVKMPTTPDRCNRNLLIASIAVFCNMTSWRSLEVLQSSLNHEVGTVAVASIYVTAMLSSFVFPAYFIKKITPRKCLIICPVGYAVYTAANFYPVVYTLVPATVLAGICSSIQWPAVLVYISKLCDIKSSCTKNENNVNAKYFGIFYCIVNFSLLVGTIFLTVLFAITDQRISKENNTSLVSMNYTNISFIVNHECGLYYEEGGQEKSTSSSTLNDHIVYIIISIFLFLNIATSVLFYFLDEITDSSDHLATLRVKNIEESDTKDTKEHIDSLATPNHCLMKQLHPKLRKQHSKRKFFKCSNSAKAVFKLICSDKISWLSFLMSMHVGTLQAFSRSTYNAAWVSCSQGIRYVAYVSLCLGALQPLGSLISVYALRYMNHISLFTIATFLETSVTVVIFIWTPTEDGKVILFVIAATLAVAHGVFLSQVPSAYNLLFPEDRSAAMSLHYLGLFLGGGIINCITALSHPIVPLIFNTSCLLLGYLLFITGFKTKNKKRCDHSNQSSSKEEL
ncbi:protein unc-93 homolog A-like isoform X2 [Clavelina lepadiformis]|uniref:protein unc-93 homolog A-like isoform X2 n=1 Tax=Clavelina lepadiformis TaxID=159417 RepID=UPI0040434861